MKRTKFLFNKLNAISWLLLLLLVSSCENGSNTPPNTDVGPEGGIINGPDGCKLEIPAGALDSKVTITITKASGTAAGASFAGSIYEFEPHGLQFAESVTVTIPFDANEYGGDISKLKLLWAALLEGPWEALEKSVVDSTSGTITGQTTHFSFFSAGSDARTDAVVCGSAECGTVDDNYGVARACGTCTSPDTCESNMCLCTDDRSISAVCGSYECDTVDDICGTAHACGTCISPETCQSNMCAIDCGNPTTMYSCRATQYEHSVCVDYPTETWTCGDAFISCSDAAKMGGGQIDTWSDTNCVQDNFYTIWRCHATSDGEVAVPVYYIYAEVMPLGICTGVYFGTVVERDGDTWQGYESEPDGGSDGDTDVDTDTDADTDTDTDTDTDADCAQDCEDAGIPVADGDMYSCRATSYDSPTCTDYPSATWSPCCAVESCAASAESGGGQIDEWAGSNCAADNFPTTWRCDATSDGTDTVPLYYAYAEALPVGICTGVLLGTVVYRPGDTWTDYE